MKALINGIEYDTDTATELAAHHDESCFETLYQKEGKLFFYRRKGPDMSILPITQDEAKKWAESCLSEHICAVLFEQPDELVHLRLTMRQCDADRLKQAASNADASVEEYILSLLP